jgi:hypothetical protein
MRSKAPFIAGVPRYGGRSLSIKVAAWTAAIILYLGDTLILIFY